MNVEDEVWKNGRIKEFRVVIIKIKFIINN